LKRRGFLKLLGAAPFVAPALPKLAAQAPKAAPPPLLVLQAEPAAEKMVTVVEEWSPGRWDVLLNGQPYKVFQLEQTAEQRFAERYWNAVFKAQTMSVDAARAMSALDVALH
jgi:hypothetical protein